MSGPCVDLEALKQNSWRDYALRFAFGAIVVALAGLVAHWFGPIVGGLFLGAPSILPASLTLVEKHASKGAAIDDSLGAAFGSIGLLAFGAVVWVLAAQVPAWGVLLAATFVWIVISVGVWAMTISIRPEGAEAPAQHDEAKEQRP